MVRRVTTVRPAAWSALLAVTVAGTALVWHLLACVESPMAFSPDGRQLAFVTLEPYEADHDDLTAGAYAFRLLAIDKDGQLRTIEQTTTHMLTAPVYTPDGKSLCYLRAPMLTAELREQVEKHVEQNDQALQGIKDFVWPPPYASDTPPAGPQDRAVPSLDCLLKNTDQLRARPWVNCQLVVRDAASDAVRSTIPVRLPILSFEAGYLMAYVLLRPQFDPAGEWLYVCAGGAALAINPQSGEQRILSATATVGSLAPDGKWLAVIDKELLGFVRTDGEVTVCRRWEKPPCLAGFGWFDANTLAVLSPESEKDAMTLDLIAPDGRVRRTVALSLPAIGDAKDSGPMLAIAPDGQHLVVAVDSDAYFCQADGKVLHHLHVEGEHLAQPTFSPDSKRVALKHLAESPIAGEPAGDASAAPSPAATSASCSYTRTTEIIFFTPGGEELKRIAIPPIDPATTRPAGEEG